MLRGKLVVCEHLGCREQPAEEEERSERGWEQEEGRTHLTFRWIISSLRPHVSLPLSTPGRGAIPLTPHPFPSPLPHRLIPRFLRHPPLIPPTSRLHLLCRPPTPHPEGIIFTLTTSINLTPSCTQTRTHTAGRACLHSHIIPPSRINHRC